MPINYIKSLVKEGKGTKKSLEKKWKEAEKQAEQQGQGSNYAYRTAIFKKMVHASVSEGVVARFLLEHAK